MIEKFDIGLAYVWEYDEEFIHKFEEVFHANNLTTFVIGHHNIEEVRERVKEKQLQFHFYFDRAWDVEESFEKLGYLLMKRKTHFFNPHKKVLHAIDKATMHLEFITAGLNVPYSIIIPPVTEKEELFISLSNLAILGRPFIIKPCNTTGGGIGVVTGAESLHDVLYERKFNHEDKYLLQEKIYPALLEGKRAWFRVFYAFGKIIPVWWDDLTHCYQILFEEEIEKFNLRKLFQICRTIYKTVELDFFSTEIVLTSQHKFIVIDYVNDQCDLRFQSGHVDGVPDEIVSFIIHAAKNEVLKLKRKFKL
ncbi:MAG: hypothetical protein M0Q21_01175 [Ignavibacteriaceae bacterium]|nr:hypothetical protein [Ignavibacteriaceae bacterium]